MRHRHARGSPLPRRLGPPLARPTFRRGRQRDVRQPRRRRHASNPRQLPAGGNPVRDFLRWVEPSALWALFFLTSVYGHLALKLSVARAGSSSYGSVLWASVTDSWGWSALLAWSLSCVLWSLPLSRHDLMTANAI